MICDKILFDTKNHQLLQCLLREKDFTLQNTIDMCTLAQESHKQAKEMRVPTVVTAGTSAEKEVHALRTRCGKTHPNKGPGHSADRKPVESAEQSMTLSSARPMDNDAINVQGPTTTHPCVEPVKVGCMKSAKEMRQMIQMTSSTISLTLCILATLTVV